MNAPHRVEAAPSSSPATVDRTWAAWHRDSVKSGLRRHSERVRDRCIGHDASLLASSPTLNRVDNLIAAISEPPREVDDLIAHEMWRCAGLDFFVTGIDADGCMVGFPYYGDRLVRGFVTPFANQDHFRDWCHKQGYGDARRDESFVPIRLGDRPQPPTQPFSPTPPALAD